MMKYLFSSALASTPDARGRAPSAVRGRQGRRLVARCSEHSPAARRGHVAAAGALMPNESMKLTRPRTVPHRPSPSASLRSCGLAASRARRSARTVRAEETPMRRFSYLVALAVAAGACGRTPSRTEQPSRSTPPPGMVAVDGPHAARSSASCPDRDFTGFLTTFAEQPAAQRRFTRDPLEYIVVEDGTDGPAPVERRVSPDSVPEPLFLSAAARTRAGLEMRVDSTQATRRVVVLAKPDTDYRLDFTFERVRNGCWQLTRYENASL